MPVGGRPTHVVDGGQGAEVIRLRDVCQIGMQGPADQRPLEIHKPLGDLGTGTDDDACRGHLSVSGILKDHGDHDD